MKTLDRLFEEIEVKVQEQREQDEWDALAKSQFPELGKQLFDRIEALLQPLQLRLGKYDGSSVKHVWNVQRTDSSLKIRFGLRELEFKPIGEQAKQYGDRFTVQILRKNEELVGRYFLITHPGEGALSLGVLGQSTVSERLEDRHLIELLLGELLKD